MYFLYFFSFQSHIQLLCETNMYVDLSLQMTKKENEQEHEEVKHEILITCLSLLCSLFFMPQITYREIVGN